MREYQVRERGRERERERERASVSAAAHELSRCSEQSVAESDLRACCS